MIMYIPMCRFFSDYTCCLSCECVCVYMYVCVCIFVVSCTWLVCRDTMQIDIIRVRIITYWSLCAHKMCNLINDCIAKW